MRRHSLEIWVVAAAAMLVACGGASAPSRLTMGADMAATAPEPAPPPGGAAGDAASRIASAGNTIPAGAQAAGGSALKPATNKPLLIYTATLNLAVFEAVEAIDMVEKIARDRNGYLVKRTDTSITVRVPAEIFHPTLEEMAKLGDVTHRDITAQDVTAQFRDLEVRLKNLDAVRARLSKLLEGAKTVKDALAVERELERVTTQMEQIKGQLKLLGELIAFSTINVNFQVRPAEKVDSDVVLPFPWLRDLGLPRLLQL